MGRLHVAIKHTLDPLVALVPVERFGVPSDRKIIECGVLTAMT